MRYCSWDVRDLAGDWGWSEVTDCRDTSSPLFRSPSSETLYLSVNLLSGLVTLYTEEESALRNVICSRTISQFEELEKLFQLDTSVSRLMSAKLDPKEVSAPNLSNENLSESRENIINPVKDGTIDVEAFGSIFRRWDQEEKNMN